MDAPRFFADLERVSRNPTALYKFAKEIDNYPGPGTFSVMGCRAFMYTRLQARQLFYEPLPTYDAVLAAVMIKARGTDNITIAFAVFSGAHHASGGRIESPRSDETPLGWHQVRVIGWEENGERLIVVNSWGRRWGNKGLGSVGRAYLGAHLTEAWLGRDVRFGPTRWKRARFDRARDDRDFARLWFDENPRWRSYVTLGNKRLVVLTYETISFGEECVAEVIELRNGLSVRLGWTFLFHLGRGRNVSLVKEMFVFPPYRRRGYGRLLEAAAAERARQVGSAEIQILLLEADALPRSRANGRLFAQAMSYNWTWRRSARPNTEGFATRLL